MIQSCLTRKRFSHRHPQWKKIRQHGTIAVCELGGHSALALLWKAMEAVVGVAATFSSGQLNISISEVRLYTKKKFRLLKLFHYYLNQAFYFSGLQENLCVILPPAFFL